MVSIDKLIQKLTQHQQYLNAVNNLLHTYPSQQDLFQLLVVNHESDKHEKRLLERLDKARHSMWFSANYRYDVANSIKEYWNQWLDENRFDFWIGIEDQSTLTLLETGKPVKVEFNGWQAIITPQLYASKPMETDRPSYVPRKVYLPLAWQGSHECKDVVHAKIEWRIVEIYDLNRKYIQLGGKIVDADSAYQKMKKQDQSRNWLWRWLYKVPSKDDWFKQLESQHRFMELGSYYGFTDKTIIQKLAQSSQLQSELLNLVAPETEKIQKQLNTIWHDQLNYPKIEFGQTVLHHLN